MIYRAFQITIVMAIFISFALVGIRFINEWKLECRVHCRWFVGNNHLIDWETLLIGTGAIFGFYSSMIRKQRERLFNQSEVNIIKSRYIQSKFDFQKIIISKSKENYKKISAPGLAIFDFKTLLRTQKDLNEIVEELGGLNIGRSLDNEALDSAIALNEEFLKPSNEPYTDDEKIQINEFITRTFEMMERQLDDGQNFLTSWKKHNQVIFNKLKNKVGI